ncbi:MAG: hypothetical protein MJZ08_02115 [Bacteroidaceae bacterium]|nr:hypothetical protein [Bacteroidaceae bacterium]
MQKQTVRRLEDYYYFRPPNIYEQSCTLRKSNKLSALTQGVAALYPGLIGVSFQAII